MVYRTNYNGSGAGPGGCTCGGTGSCGCDDGYVTSLREYWQKSYEGVHLVDFQTGTDAGKADLAADAFDYLAVLEAVESSLRDLAWNARVDGYADSTKSRGPIKLR